MPACVQDGPDGGGADLVAEAGELAVDASVSPGGVLGGQADHQGAQAGGDGGSTGSGRLCGPAAGDELAVPAQDRGRGDEQPEAAADGQQPGEGGDQGAVGPGHQRARRASLEHGELVAQDQDLDLLGGVGSSAQHDPAQELGEHLVDQPQRHERIMPGHMPLTNEQVTGCARNFGHPHVKDPQKTDEAATKVRTDLKEVPLPTMEPVPLGRRELLVLRRLERKDHRERPDPGSGAPAASATKAPRTKVVATGRPDPVMTKALFASPLLRSLQSRRVHLFSKKGTLRNPQYVSGRTFARALVDLLVPAAPGGQADAAVYLAEIEKGVRNLPPGMPIRGQLLDFLAAAGKDLSAFESALEQWYDEEMNKIAGWYKRWSRVALGIVGFIIAAFLNLDAIQVAHTLYVDAPVQQAVLSSAEAGALCQSAANPADRETCAKKELGDLQAAGLPVGWPDWPVNVLHTLLDYVFKVIGLAITAFAVSFGAPFWFDALSKLGSLRTAAKRPGDT